MKDNVLLARPANSTPSQAGFFLTLFSYLTHYLPLLKIKIPLTFRGCGLVLEHLGIIPVPLKRVWVKKGGQTTCHRIKGGFHNRALQKLAILLCVRMLVCVFMCTCHTVSGTVRGQLCGGGSLLVPLYGFWGLSWNPRLKRQSPLPTEPSFLL